jgi:hypothetical protein
MFFADKINIYYQSGIGNEVCLSFQLSLLSEYHLSSVKYVFLPVKFVQVSMLKLLNTKISASLYGMLGAKTRLDHCGATIFRTRKVS